MTEVEIDQKYPTTHQKIEGGVQLMVVYLALKPAEGGAAYEFEAHL